MDREPPQIDNAVNIVTPENIAFQYQLAGPFRRLPAYLIDWLLRFAILAFAGVLLMSVGAPLGAGGGAIALFALLLFVMEWFYGGLFEAYFNGQTPGKRLLGIRVLTVDGQPINGLQAVMRNILRTVDIMPPSPVIFVPTCLVGLVSCTVTRRCQRLGDVVCGTMVVVEERGWMSGVAKLEDPRAVELAALLPPTFRVGRSMARTLGAYVERRMKYSPPRRREIARHLAEPLLVEFGLPADTSYDLLLCALYHRTFIAEGAGPRRATAAVGGTA